MAGPSNRLIQLTHVQSASQNQARCHHHLGDVATLCKDDSHKLVLIYRLRPVSYLLAQPVVADPVAHRVPQ